ncbi:MAG: TonB family protein [Phaeodactylibacter sp.]|uniref:TonB family protein n=1 Tax=Phaeodactylibacter sp. TaxID=1940289 RepID=UPI0032EF4A0C
MKTICIAIFTCCLFTFANAQYTAHLTLEEVAAVQTPKAERSLSAKIAKRNALIQTHNRQAQQTLMQYLADAITYPEKLRTIMKEGRVVVVISVDQQGHISQYRITQSPDPAFDAEVVRVMNEAPALIDNRQAYVGARRMIIPIDFSMR